MLSNFKTQLLIKQKVKLFFFLLGLLLPAMRQLYTPK